MGSSIGLNGIISLNNSIKTKVYISSITKFDDDELYNKALSKVSEQCISKISRLKSHNDKSRSLLAELLLIKALKEEGLFQFNPEYEYRLNNKPYLKNYPNIFFNKSHSNDIVICGISSYEIGCDVEKVKKKDLKIAEHFFTEEEYRRIQNENKDDQQDLFFRFWTLKESFLKITGLGMKLPLNSFSIDIDKEYPEVFYDRDSLKYYLRELDINSDYKCSICGFDKRINESGGVEIIDTDIEDLMSDEM